MAKAGFRRKGGHKRTGRSKQVSPEPLKRLNPDAAGIDIGSATHWVAVPADRDAKPVREFSTFTTGLEELADWLKACGVRTVAMESTSVYWIPVFELLESRGFEVKLVDPHRLKSVPGRKTDIVDCQWIQELHSYGLLVGAFRPEEKVCELRSYLRQRAQLVRAAAQDIQHMQKALEQMNVKLTQVLSDINGVTGLRIIKAILAGERDGRKLAKLRHERCQHSVREIAEALRGNWKEEHLFVLRQALEGYAFTRQQIVVCDQKIEPLLKDFEDRSGGKVLEEETKKGARGLNFDAREGLFRMAGVDLTKVAGLDSQSALQLLGEIGVDMSAWPSEKHFASWLAVCPGNKVSGGKRLSGRTKPCANRAADILRLAAQALHKSRSALGAFFRRMKARLGPAKATTAAAHKLALIVYRMLKYRQEYRDLGQDHYERQYQVRVITSMARKAKQFGYKLVKIEELPQVQRV